MRVHSGHIWKCVVGFSVCWLHCHTPMSTHIHRNNCFCGILAHCCFWIFLHTGHMQPFSNFSLFHIFWNKLNHFLQFSVSNNSMLLLCWLGGDWLKIRFCVRPTFSVVKLAPEPLIFSRARNFAAVSIMLKWSDTGKISWAKLSLKLCSAFLFLDCPNLFIIFRPKICNLADRSPSLGCVLQQVVNFLSGFLLTSLLLQAFSKSSVN